MKHIMFVCTGNICRSPMAEYLLKNTEAVQPLKLTVDSSGLGALIGHSANPPVRQLLSQDGIDCSGHLARQMNEAMALSADLILVMEHHHRKEVIRRFPKTRSKVYLLGHHDQHEIKDPYRQDMLFFETVKKEIEIRIESWVKVLCSL